MMSVGLISFSRRLLIALPIFLQSSCLTVETASCELLPGKLIPKASIAEAIVFAVYMPPQEPGPGRAVFSIAINSSSEILLLEKLPTPSITVTKSVWFAPGLIDPP